MAKVLYGRRGKIACGSCLAASSITLRERKQGCRGKPAPFIFHSDEERCQRKPAFIDNILPSRGLDLGPNGSREKSVKSIQTRSRPIRRMFLAEVQRPL